MKRRDFIEISAAVTVAVALGGFTGSDNPWAVNTRTDRDFRLRGYPRMRGGCKDFRAMNDSIPGFFEREIIDNWA